MNHGRSESSTVTGIANLQTLASRPAFGCSFHVATCAAGRPFERLRGLRL
jgi:hypothetical protein